MCGGCSNSTRVSVRGVDARTMARARAFGRASAWARAVAVVSVVVGVALDGARAAVTVTNGARAGGGVVYVGSASARAVKVDACGTCGGDGRACAGCDGVASSGTAFDACGTCGTACDANAGQGCAFNATCWDCASVTNGASLVDACGECKDPTNATFSRAGVPDYHLGGCVGCDGVANSGTTLDVCGVCGGNGCEGEDSSQWSWCCDCTGVAFGSHVKDLCCSCVDGDTYYPNGVKPDAHTQIEELWELGQTKYVAAKAALTALSSQTSGERMHAEGAQALFQEAKTAYEQAWALVETQRTVQGTTMCYPTLTPDEMVNKIGRDACGTCSGDRSLCLGCSVGDTPLPIGPLGGLHEDDCGVCVGSNVYDVCGVCEGFNTEGNNNCRGCDGVTASGAVNDACYGSSDPRMVDENGDLKFPLGTVGSGCSVPSEFKTACDAGGGGCCGCDGVPNSGKSLDICGTCLGASDPARVTNAGRCDDAIFLVRLPSGLVIGPYTRSEVRSGFLTYTDTSTLTDTVYTVSSDTLIANAEVENVVANVSYGMTSVAQEYVDSWRSIFVDQREDVLSASSEPNVTNVVTVSARSVQNTSEYVALQYKEEFLGSIYPYCTGATYGRYGVAATVGHRLHGKKTGANYLGLITTGDLSDLDDWNDALDKVDFSWNKLDQYILDKVEGWADQRCECQSEWRFYPEPIPPTCERVWLQASDEEKTASMERSAATGSWTVDGGWWKQDYGQKTSQTQLSARGPFRIDAFGYLSKKITHSAGQETDEKSPCEYEAMRIIDGTSNSTGAVWYPERQPVLKGFEVNFTFMITQASILCESVDSVSRAFQQSIHNKLYEKCRTSGGDGFAFVIRDDVTVLSASALPPLGRAGPNLGYAGINNSIAFEFDTVYNADFNEPREGHVSIQTRGRLSNTAHSSASLASTTKTVNDGRIHTVVIKYEPALDEEELLFRLESGDVGLSTALTSHTADTIGVLSLYLDDLTSPLMSVPFNFESVLRDDSTEAWVGFTASSGDNYQAVDVIDWSMVSTT